MAIITTLADVQSLLNNPVFYGASQGSLEASADDYYLNYNDWLTRDENIRRMYTWEKDNLFKPGTANDWALNYSRINTTNEALDHLNKIERVPGDENEWRNIKGWAHFLRAQAFLHLASIFTIAYDPATASSDLGLPLRLHSDFNEPSVRSTLQQTYDQIIKDLEEAASLLYVVPAFVVQPSKPAAYALLARTYLFIRNYDSSFVYSNACLGLRNALFDYNGVSTSSPIPRFNPEVIFHTSTVLQPIVASRLKIDSILYRSYDPDDLRKSVYFANAGPGQFSFRGSYEGPNSGTWFCGPATDEVYLMRAECYARKGMITEAMEDINTLMRKRWRNTVSYPLITANTVPEALNKVLAERRKELLFRGLRWMDIKRLNKEGYNISLKRVLNGNVYILSPNSLRYALPIPEDVIRISGMPQNQR